MIGHRLHALRVYEDVEADGTRDLADDSTNALRERHGVTPRHDVRSDERIGENLFHFTTRTIRRQLMCRRSKIPCDALELFLHGSRDDTYWLAGGVDHRQQH